MRELFALAREKHYLVWELAKKQVATEHAGKAFGPFWGIMQPLFLFALYAFIYGVVFRVKIGGTFDLPLNFTVYLLSGLVPWLSFLFLMARSTTLMSRNAHLVKQVVFELALLPIAAALAACLALALGIAFIGIYTLADHGSVAVTYLAVPFLVVVQFIAMLGSAFILASIGVFFRDIDDVVQMGGIVLLFLMPIVYLPTAVPSEFKVLLWLNPFTYMVWCYQDVMYFGRIEHPEAWIVFPALALVCLIGGYRLFRRLRPHFANVL